MRQATTPSDMKCTICGNTTPIARKRAKLKEVGHIKHMWCFKCKAETAHETKESKYVY